MKTPWGWMITLFKTRKMWLKIIHVKKDHRTSLQYHNNRTEYHFGLTKIPPGTKHRMEHGIYIELATGEPEEKDIIRLEDDYGRSS